MDVLIARLTVTFAIATALVASTAHGRVEIDPSRLEPYCALDETTERGRNALRFFSTIVGVQSHVLGFLFRCTDLGKLLDGEEKHVAEWLIVYERTRSGARMPQLSANVTRADLLKQLVQSYKGPRPAIESNDLKGVNDAVRELGTSVNGVADVGLLGWDANAVYYGGLTRRTTPAGTSQDTAIVSAVTLYRQRMTIFALYSRYQGIPDFAALVAQQKTNMSRFLP